MATGQTSWRLSAGIVHADTRSNRRVECNEFCSKWIEAAVVSDNSVRCSQQKTQGCLRRAPTGIHPCNNVTRPRRILLILKSADFCRTTGVFSRTTTAYFSLLRWEYSRRSPQSRSSRKSGSWIIPVEEDSTFPFSVSRHVPSRGSNHCARCELRGSAARIWLRGQPFSKCNGSHCFPPKVSALSLAAFSEFFPV